MRGIFGHRRQSTPLATTLQQLECWFDGERGCQMLADQQRHVDRALAHCFGYHLLQLSVSSQIELYAGCRVQKKYRAHPYAPAMDARCSFEQLPFANESLDVVILHHVLEFIDDPHQLLREVQRVLVPRGHLVILGFNPWSAQGLYCSLAGWLAASMWQNQLISARRLRDWLSLLAFDARWINYGSHHPRFIEQQACGKSSDFWSRWPLGDYYMISAVKQQVRLTPSKFNWQQATGFAAIAPAKPRLSRSSSVAVTRSGQRNKDGSNSA